MGGLWMSLTIPKKVRTSESHPLKVDFVESDKFNGRIGMTFCPGKHQPDAMTGAWIRDLETDVARLASMDVKHVVTLMEQHELERLNVPNLGRVIRTHDMSWHHLPIPDGRAPDDAFSF